MLTLPCLKGGYAALPEMHTVLAGGVGAARYLCGAVEAFDPSSVSAVVNVGDDVILHGLHVSPDLDTCTYALAGVFDDERGWGLINETWQAMTQLDRYGGESWFGLGDRDIGTHLYRTARLREGATLTEVTAEIATAWGLRCRLLPVTDDRLQTRVTLAEGEQQGSEIDFQEYFVRRRHNVAVSSTRFAGADTAKPSSLALSAIVNADVLVIAPSNPVVSIAPVLAVPGVADAVRQRRDNNAAVSPIVGGSAIKGPAARLLRELGEESSVVGVARVYRDLAAVLVIDEQDADLASAVAETGMTPVVTATVMSDPATSAALARCCHAAVSTTPMSSDPKNGS